MIIDYVDSIIEAWNTNLKAQEFPYKIELQVKCRLKTFYLSKEKTYEQEIAELSLLQVGTPTLLLYHNELRMPPKVKGETKVSLENKYKDSLYKQLAYEAIGAFTVITSQTITNKDYAEYDLVKERLKADPKFDGFVIEALKDGAFYQAGDKFDVFTQVEDGWAIYTAHDCAKGNNGITKVSGAEFKIIQEPVKKLDLIMP